MNAVICFNIDYAYPIPKRGVGGEGANMLTAYLLPTVELCCCAELCGAALLPFNFAGPGAYDGEDDANTATSPASRTYQKARSINIIE